MPPVSDGLTTKLRELEEERRRILEKAAEEDRPLTEQEQRRLQEIDRQRDEASGPDREPEGPVSDDPTQAPEMENERGMPEIEDDGRVPEEDLDGLGGDQLDMEERGGSPRSGSETAGGSTGFGRLGRWWVG
jgi:hypothetical protein